MVALALCKRALPDADVPRKPSGVEWLDDAPVRMRAGLESLFHKSDLSENWAFWIPAFAGMTDLEVIFHTLARKVVENRFGMLGINHG